MTATISVLDYRFREHIHYLFNLVTTHPGKTKLLPERLILNTAIFLKDKRKLFRRKKNLGELLSRELILN
jgi:hypothetical protein